MTMNIIFLFYHDKFMECLYFYFNLLFDTETWGVFKLVKLYYLTRFDCIVLKKNICLIFGMKILFLILTGSLYFIS